MRQPTTQYWTWARTVPQFVVMILVVSVFWPFFEPGSKVIAVASAAIVYVVYSQASRWFLARKHRLGVREAGRKNYDRSIRLFRASIDFFEKYGWLDKYRAIFLLTPSVWTYREMGLLSIAANYSAQGNVRRVKETLEELLREFPGNEHARQSLAIIEKAGRAADA